MSSRQCKNNWLDTYLEYTAFQEAPLKFHMWTGLSTLASVLQRKVKLPRGYFNIFPNLYVALVAPSGFTKTSAADISIKFLKEVKRHRDNRGKGNLLVYTRLLQRSYHKQRTVLCDSIRTGDEDLLRRSQ